MTRTDYTFIAPFRVRYAETDAQGIVFYGNYLIYIDTTIYDYIRSLPFDINEHVERTGADFHVVHVSLDYLDSVGFDAVIYTGLRIKRIGRSSIVFEVNIFSEKIDTTLVKSEVVWAYVDQTTQKSLPLPDDFLKKIKEKEPAP